MVDCCINAELFDHIFTFVITAYNTSTRRKDIFKGRLPTTRQPWSFASWHLTNRKYFSVEQAKFYTIAPTQSWYFFSIKFDQFGSLPPPAAPLTRTVSFGFGLPISEQNRVYFSEIWCCMGLLCRNTLWHTKISKTQIKPGLCKKEQQQTFLQLALAPATSETRVQ